MDVLEGLVSPEQVQFTMDMVDDGPPQDFQGSSVPYDDGLRSTSVRAEQVRFTMDPVDGGPPQDFQGSSASYNRYEMVKRQTKGGQSICCSILQGVGFLACFPVVGASSASAPGSSTSGTPSALQIFSYVVGSATVIGTILAFIVCWHRCYRRRERGGVRGALDSLNRLFRELPSGTYMSVELLEVGEEMMNGLVVDSRV